MPRKPHAVQAPVQFLRRTAADLAEALGVHRNSIGAWRAAGAPEVLDEFQWRVWAAALAAKGRGYDCPKDPEPALLQLLASAGVNGYRDRQLAAHPALAGDAPAGAGIAGDAALRTISALTPVTSKERIDAAKAVEGEISARTAQLELDLRERRVVRIEDTHRLLDAWLQALDDVLFADLEQLPAEVSALPEIRDQVRVALERRLRASRERLADELEQRLKTYLETHTERS